MNRPFAPLVIKALRMKDKEVRLQAMEVAGSLGPDGEPAVAVLVDALKDNEEKIRSAAAGALGRLGPVAKTAVPPLTAALNDKADLARCEAAMALGEIGPAAKPAVPSLLRLMSLQDGRHFPQVCAGRALLRMSAETKAMVPADMQKEIAAAFGITSSAWLDPPDPTQPKPKKKPKPRQVF